MVAIDCNVCRRGYRGVRGAVDLEPRRTGDGQSQWAVQNQWMRWTKEGLEALLQFRVVKYTDPEHYRAFLDELLQRPTKTALSCDLSAESTRGKR